MKQSQKWIVSIHLFCILLASSWVLASENTTIPSSMEQVMEQTGQAVNLQSFVEEIQSYANEYFPELADPDYLQQLLQGNLNLDQQSLGERLLTALLGEMQKNISLILKIVGIAIVCTILKSIQNSFGEGSIGDIAFYVCYLMVVALLIASFTNVVSLCTETIAKLANFMNMVVPLLFALITVTGKLSTISFLQPLILGMISFISFLLNRFLIPMIYTATVIHIVTNLSNHMKLDKLSELLKKSALWVMEISLVIFAGLLSLEGTLASSVDGMTSKIAKNVVSSAIPVVGKILGDTVDSVLGGITITKNAIGVLGILAVLAIAVGPLLKSLITMVVFQLSAAFMEPIADSRIAKCMDGMAGSLKIMVGMLAVIVFMFMIAITMMIKISNTVFLYQS